MQENLVLTFNPSTDKVALAGAAVAGVSTVILVAPTPAQAQNAGVTEVSTMVASLGGIATAAMAVAIVPIGIYFAIRIVKRVMNA